MTLLAGHAVAQLVEAMRYKPEGRGFDSRWCHWNFSLTQSFRPLYCPRVDSASNRYEYKEYFLGGKGGRCVRLTLPPSYADCLEIWKPQPSGTLTACPGFTFTFIILLAAQTKIQLIKAQIFILLLLLLLLLLYSNVNLSRSRWPRGLRRRSTAARLLRL